MQLSKRLRIGWRVSAFAVTTLVYWCCFELACFFRSRDQRIRMINRWVPRWSRLMLKIYGVTVTINGESVETRQPYPTADRAGVGRVFVANHRSAYDIPVLFTAAEAHVISRHDLATWPLLGRSARRVGTLFVDRASRRSGASVLKKVDQALAAGEGVAMFPEGTSHEGDEVREFRPGAFNAARRAGGEIVPIGLAYGDDLAYFRKEPFLSHIQRIAGLSTLRVAVEVGDPLQIGDRSSVEMKEIARKKVQELVNRGRTRLNE